MDQGTIILTSAGVIVGFTLKELPRILLEKMFGKNGKNGNGTTAAIEQGRILEKLDQHSVYLKDMAQSNNEIKQGIAVVATILRERQ